MRCALPMDLDSCMHTLRHRCRGSQRYSVILSTRMQPMVLTASALIRGLGSWVSCAFIGIAREGHARQRSPRPLIEAPASHPP